MDTPLQEREKLTGEIRVSPQLLKETQKNAGTLEAFQKQFEIVQKEDVSTALAFLLDSALNLDTSDVHMEPMKENIKIRFRIDGLLQDASELSLETYKGLISRIKLASGLKLNIVDRPQDGRFSLVLPESPPIEIRTATLPSEYGESAVLRILNPKSLITLEQLGLRKDLQELFEKEIKKPNGMIIVTGPTGSGKTTTLYAFLHEVQKPDIKIITIEDPIEYHLQGISQTQVNPAQGYDFASGLRAIVRQDPDIVLVGEIRDGETADIALQAALTGHLVFSTLHTNDAAGTISRLQSLGSQLSTITSALTLIIAQRLLRKVCSQCKNKNAPSSQDLKKIQEGLASVKTLELPDFKKVELLSPKGCAKCNFTGYKGRIGVYEAIQVDDQMEEFLLSTPSIASLKALAVKKGMITMYQDGLLKVLEGVTTLQELERMTEQ